ncbi:NYN domain-containing protein [Tropicimonas aquimaris]|uniref:NYN domain-containing protein n=1 Tax=Tropicimonas aquimaris TaxID=914152 RepID=A0ABW3IM41_9RHOB
MVSVSSHSGPVALLIDGDNISADHAPEILRLARMAGELRILRVYGDACKLPKWDAVPGLRMVHSGRGKNATDMLLCIEAMEIAFAGVCGTVVLVSSDGDFTHLAQHLRERGVAVLGIGEAKAPESFRRSCARFHEIKAGSPVLAQPVRSNPKCEEGPSERDLQIRDLIATNSTGGQGMELKTLGVRMSRDFGVKISELPERTWRRYFVQRGKLFALDPPGPSAKVRFLPKGFNGH